MDAWCMDRNKENLDRSVQVTGKAQEPDELDGGDQHGYTVKQIVSK